MLIVSRDSEILNIKGIFRKQEYKQIKKQLKQPKMKTIAIAFIAAAATAFSMPDFQSAISGAKDLSDLKEKARNFVDNLDIPTLQEMKEEMGVDKSIDEIKDMVKESFDNLTEDAMDAIHHDQQGNQLA